jgi:hypothetical protein
MARIVAEQHHTVSAKYAESVFELAKRTVNVGEGQGREASEAMRPPRHKLGTEFVDAACHLSPGGSFPSGHAGSGKRQDSGRDPLSVHEGKRGIG